MNVPCRTQNPQTRGESRLFATRSESLRRLPSGTTFQVHSGFSALVVDAAVAQRRGEQVRMKERREQRGRRLKGVEGNLPRGTFGCVNLNIYQFGPLEKGGIDQTPVGHGSFPMNIQTPLGTRPLGLVRITRSSSRSAWHGPARLTIVRRPNSFMPSTSMVSLFVGV